MTHEDTIKSLRREIRIMQESLESKNKELDAMHYVWCDGGCPSGAHRHTPGAITEELVVLAERNVARMRRYFENKEYRDAKGWNKPT